MNINGKYSSVEKIGENHHNVRILEFIPGQIFHQVPKTNHLFYQAGEFIGRIDNALKHFKHDALDHHRTLWMLDSVPKLSEFLYAVKDEEKKGIIEQVLEAFDKQIVQNNDKFAKGIIHGDFNEQNILVNLTEKPDEYKITGVIDFGDINYSCYVYELAITTAYMLLQSGDISTGGLVLAGYSMVRNVPEHEKQVLKVRSLHFLYFFNCLLNKICTFLILDLCCCSFVSKLSTRCIQSYLRSRQ